MKNKLGVEAKAAIEACFKGMGGADALQAWAEKNPTEFYTKIYVKVIPLQMQHDGIPSVPLFALPAGSMPAISKDSE